MRRLAVTLCVFLIAQTARADSFDLYINPVLAKVPEAKEVKELKELSPDLITDHDRVLGKVTGAFVVVRTNEGRWAKLLVQSGSMKAGEDRRIPVLIIERFVTYREGQERTIEASGKSLSLYPGFRLSLDLGQVVPEQMPADLRFVVNGDKVHAETVGKAKMYLLTAPMPEATPKKGEKFVFAEPFEARYFSGTFKLLDDGRRAGRLKLTVDKEGNVSGAYYSDRDDQKYEVAGKVGMPLNSIQFTVKF